MPNLDKMSERQILESMYTKMAVHEAKHESQDVLITNIASAIWGNGKVGLKSKVHLLMAVLGVVSMVVAGVVADVLIRHGVK